MNYGMEDQPQSNISKYLVVSVTLKGDDNLGKFDSRTDEGIFLGYSSTKKAYRCYNKRLHKIVESVDVKVDDIKPRKEKNLDSIENT